jgi:hypothetical protein
LEKEDAGLLILGIVCHQIERRGRSSNFSHIQQVCVLDVIFTVAWPICAGLVEPTEQPWHTPSRTRDYRRRDDSCDSFSNIRPKNAFLLYVLDCSRGMFFVWTVIPLTHLRFRHSIDRETLDGLPLRLHGHRLPTLASIAAIAAIALSTFWVDGTQYTLPMFVSLLLVMSMVYVGYRNRHQPNGA